MKLRWHFLTKKQVECLLGCPFEESQEVNNLLKYVSDFTRGRCSISSAFRRIAILPSQPCIYLQWNFIAVGSLQSRTEKHLAYLISALSSFN